MVYGNKKNGVSEVVAVLLMVSLTVIIAGIVTIWVSSITSESEEDNSFYIFDIDLDGSDNTIIISLVNGPYLNSTKMKLIIGGVEIKIPEKTIQVGEILTFDTGMDIIQGTIYHVKLVVDNKVVFDGYPNAYP